VSELGPLIKNVRTSNLRAGDEEELFVWIGGKFPKALVKEERTDRIAPGAVWWFCSGLRSNAF